MPKRLSRPGDPNLLAHQIGNEATDQVPYKPPKVTKAEISRVMAAMGRRGGKKGGKRRLETMTTEERSAVALKAANARWAKKKQAQNGRH